MSSWLLYLCLLQAARRKMVDDFSPEQVVSHYILPLLRRWNKGLFSQLHRKPNQSHWHSSICWNSRILVHFAMEQDMQIVLVVTNPLSLFCVSCIRLSNSIVQIVGQHHCPREIWSIYQTCLIHCLFEILPLYFVHTFFLIISASRLVGCQAPLLRLFLFHSRLTSLTLLSLFVSCRWISPGALARSEL